VADVDRRLAPVGGTGRDEPARWSSSTGGSGVTFPRGLVVLLGAAALVVGAAGMYAASWLIGPLLLAFVIVLAVSPVQGWLRRRGWPAWAAALSLVVVVYGTLLALSVFLVGSVSRLGTVLAQNAGSAQQLVTSLRAALTEVGIDPTQSARVADTADLSRVVSAVGGLLSGLGSVLTTLVLVVALLLFLIAESAGSARRIRMIADERPHVISALEGFVHGARKYLVVTAVFGLIVGALDGVALALMGVPLAPLWGVLSFLTTFILDIGFVVALVPPALLALATGGWQPALAVVVFYCVLNGVVQVLVQPHFIGDSVGLSTTVTFVALVFWAWILGPLGALLAIPLTLLIKAILVDADPRAGWAEALLGPSPPVVDAASAPPEP
jgi:AI-2 transport protein TqsA